MRVLRSVDGLGGREGESEGGRVEKRKEGERKERGLHSFTFLNLNEPCKLKTHNNPLNKLLVCFHANHPVDNKLCLLRTR